MKTCKACGVEKSFSEYYTDARMKDGYRNLCKICHAKGSYKSRLKHQSSEQRYLRYRDTELFRKYGIRLVDYYRLLEEQKRQCAICGRLHAEEPDKRLCVDHNHETGQIRGLLCSPCNVALGMFGDNIDVLTAATAYLLSRTPVERGLTPVVE